MERCRKPMLTLADTFGYPSLPTPPFRQHTLLPPSEKIQKAENDLREISIAYPLYPRLKFGVGLKAGVVMNLHVEDGASERTQY